MSPGIWLLLFAPVLIFAVGVLLPFLTGTFRYKAQLGDQIRWMRDWISQMQGNLELTPTEVTSEQQYVLISRLERRIREKFNENTLFPFLQTNLAGLREDDSQRRYAQITDQRREVSAGTDAIGADVSLAVVDGDPSGRSRISQDIRRAKEAITRANPFGSAVAAQQEETLLRFIREEKGKLVEWDTSYSQISQLLDLRQSIENTDRKEVVKYLHDKKNLLSAEHRDLDALKKQYPCPASAGSLNVLGSPLALR
jgi:hypothetical protein